MGANVFQPGEICGGCEIVHLLGSGGFAQVYEVVDPTGARRALKVLDTDAEARPKLRARLAQEGAALAMIEHINVVRLFDAGFHQDRIYLLLELVQGKTLRELLGAEGGRPPPDMLVRWLRQACDGVGEGHRIGVVHRDLKPENLLVGPQDLLKVIDFGIAKFSSWGVKTTHEQRLGTTLYMSPEQIKGLPADPRMDVYALGLVLYEALHGAHPICPEPATVFEVCARQVNHRPAPLSSVAREVPPALGAAVDRAIEKDPERRFPSMRAFSDALQDGLRQLDGARGAAVQRLLAGPEGPVGASRLGTTAPISVPVSPAPWHLVKTAPMSEAPASPDAVTTELAAGSITADAITVPVKQTTTPRRAGPAPARARDDGSVSAGVMAGMAVAVLIGVTGGAWLMTRVFASAAAATPAASAATAASATPAESATPAATATPTETTAPTAPPSATATATVTPTAATTTSRATSPAARAPRPRPTAAPRPRAFPNDDSPF